MLPKTNQHGSTLDDLNTIIRDAAFPISENKPLDSVNNNGNKDNMAHQNISKTYRGSTTLSPNLITSVKLQETSSSMSLDLLRNMSPSRRSSLQELILTDSRKETSRESSLANHHSIDLSVHSRASEVISCKENDTINDKFDDHKSKMLEKMESNVMSGYSPEKTEQKTILDTVMPNGQTPHLSQSSNIAPISLTNSRITSFSPSIDR